MNTDGKTKSFDQNADGQSPAECISIIFLQKARDAKRYYLLSINMTIVGIIQLVFRYFKMTVL